MPRGQLPKAYLRLDPRIYRTRTRAELGDYVALLCEAATQSPRGYFKAREPLDEFFGKRLVDRFIARRDLVQLENGSFYVDGWNEWQEGDLTVGERQRRIRSRKVIAVTSALHERDGGVTEPLQKRSSTPAALCNNNGNGSNESNSAVIGVIPTQASTTQSRRPACPACEQWEPVVVVEPGTPQRGEKFLCGDRKGGCGHRWFGQTPPPPPEPPGVRLGNMDGVAFLARLRREGAL